MATPALTLGQPNHLLSKYRIASIPGDGIGPEVVNATIEVVKALVAKQGTFDIEFTELPWGTTYYKNTGRYMSDKAFEILQQFDAVLFGSVGSPDVPNHTSLWGLLLPLRQGLQLYVNVRPTRLIPGAVSPLRDLDPKDLDWMLVRENSEGEYCGSGGRVHECTPWECGTEVATFTRVGSERVLRFAFELARKRAREQKNGTSRVTVVTKSNAMRHGMVLWDEVAARVARDFGDVEWDTMLVDAMVVRMVREPQTLDVIVGTNLHMDILSDLAAALAGSIGVAASSNLDPTRKRPSVFEPVHGSAFDIVGKGMANPVGTMWSAAEMLMWLGEKEASRTLMKAVEDVCGNGVKTPDLGGKAATREVTSAVIQKLQSM